MFSCTKRDWSKLDWQSCPSAPLLNITAQADSHAVQTLYGDIAAYAEISAAVFRVSESSRVTEKLYMKREQ